jgi:hypothetical protein
MYENDNEDSKIKIADIAVYTLMDKELLKHATTLTPQYCGKSCLFLFKTGARILIVIFPI